MTERLDAHFYPGVVDEYLKRNPEKFVSLKKLCLDIFNGQTQPETDNGCQQITVTNLSPSFIVGIPRIVNHPLKKDKFLKAHDILICNAAHNKSYIGRDLTYVHSEEEILPSTEVMTIRVNRTLMPSSYLRTYLLTKVGYVQIQSTVRGITAHSYPDDIALLEIFIPQLTDDQKTEWFACDDLMLNAGIAYELGTQLAIAAKLLVEGLIEGLVTEDELITAQRGLEAGDREADAAILRRLKTDGLDGDGQPLFADLDKVYELLAQTSNEA